MNLSNQTLLNLIPPAVILAAGLFIIRFLGKVVSDQRPFADNWDWAAESSGVYFLFVFLLVPFAVGMDIAWRYHDFGLWGWITFLIGQSGSRWLEIYLQIGHLARLIILSAIAYVLSIRVAAETERVYKIPSPLIRSIAETRSKIQKDEAVYHSYLKKVLEKKYQYFWLPIIVIILAYVVTMEYFAGNLYWFAVTSILAISSLLSVAMAFSLGQILKLPEVTVYMEGAEPVRAVLLKVTDKHIRVRKDDIVIVFNRDRVAKFEIAVEKYEHKPIPEKSPTEQ